MNLNNEIELLYKISNTLELISTRGQETIYMANCLNGLKEIINSFESKSIETFTMTIPIDQIEEE